MCNIRSNTVTWWLSIPYVLTINGEVNFSLEYEHHFAMFQSRARHYVGPSIGQAVRRVVGLTETGLLLGVQRPCHVHATYSSSADLVFA